MKNFVGRTSKDEPFSITMVSDRVYNYTRVLYRTKEHDKPFEFPLELNEKKVMKGIDASLFEGEYQLFKLSKPKLITELSSIDEVGSQDMKEVSTFKFGVVYYKEGQTEEEMFCNMNKSKEFDELLDMLGEMVVLEGWEKYDGGLDTSKHGGATSGIYSRFTKFREYEIMFHVSTYIPLLPAKKHQIVTLTLSTLLTLLILNSLNSLNSQLS